MAGEKIVYIIPGFKHKTTGKAYIKIAKILKNQGYRPVLVNIPWRKTSILQNTELFLKKYNKVRRKNKYILGFSFGAMIALVASTKVSPSGLILCSLSPYFKEDLPSSKLHGGKLARSTKAKKILMLYGTNEEKTLIKRVRSTYRQITKKRKYLIPIEKTEHNIGDRRYLNQIHQSFQLLTS